MLCVTTPLTLAQLVSLQWVTGVTKLAQWYKRVLTRIFKLLSITTMALVELVSNHSSFYLRSIIAKYLISNFKCYQNNLSVTIGQVLNYTNSFLSCVEKNTSKTLCLMNKKYIIDYRIFLKRILEHVNITALNVLAICTIFTIIIFVLKIN